MLVSLVEYAKKHNKSGDTLRRMAEKGVLKTAQKIGRNWVVDSDEEYPVKKRTTMKPITVVSLFSGCGGMDLGIIGGFDFLGKHYDKTGFDIIWANEINPAACETYKRNIGEHIVLGDINEKLDELPSYADVVIGGFPCQDISINGKMKGINGERSSLYTAIVEAVERIQPKVFIAENVGGLLLKQNEYSLKKILEDFGSLGYNVSYKLYHAVDYGVPQTRERVFIIGTRRELSEFTPPEPTCTQHITAKEALSDLELLEENKDFSHIWSKAKVSGEQGNRRLIADRPGYTIRAECHGNIQFHYSLPRRMSMREAARIQSFPDSFRFSAGLRETERQIGNAVPPVLAWHIAKSVEVVIRGNNIEKSRVRSVVG
ncbi:DNA cytosine methyltransferase [Paenibacillus sp. NPDC057967]|uniref:DNA cytosine methyltransferase n=1 Tax=Paenibacillus sp. NPDC057967 TaxID=3346293 RepID=UPI0036DA51BB